MKNLIIIMLIAFSALLASRVNYLTKELNYYEDKYKNLDKALVEIDSKEYKEDYQCKEFSEELIKYLSKEGVQASIVLGKSPSTKDNELHAWVAVWFDPQTGELTNGYNQEQETNCEKYIRIHERRSKN